MGGPITLPVAGAQPRAHWRARVGQLLMVLLLALLMTAVMVSRGLVPRHHIPAARTR